MLYDGIYYFIMGFFLTIGVLCGIATMAIVYNIIDGLGIKLKDKNDD